ncbi:MAG TPA: hypothetical protein VNX21_08135, partial [Candidatus Thermoplasmatota archaeon]|nr:hypothetical protein [Candidatus Thermoplasmatota archaeon]
ACAAWAAAALAPPSPYASPEEARAAGAAFAIVAVLLVAAIGVLVVLAWREGVRATSALKWSGYLAAGLAVFATVPAARVWPTQVPWVALGMLATLAIGGLALVAAGRMGARAAPAEETGLPGP